MPRIRQLSSEYRAKDFRLAVKGRLAINGLTQKDLAGKLAISEAQVSTLLHNPDGLTAERLRETIEYLRLPPGDVLRFLGYSEKQIKEVNGA